MRDEEIKEAKEKELSERDSERERAPRLNWLVSQARDVAGIEAKEKDYQKAIKLLEEAVELAPENEEARWGLATTLHHTGDLDRAEESYLSLTDSFPENKRYRFELGLVRIRSGKTEGFNDIREAMKDTNQFDTFLPTFAQLLEETGNRDEAKNALKIYLEKRPWDLAAKTRLDALQVVV